MKTVLRSLIRTINSFNPQWNEVQHFIQVILFFKPILADQYLLWRDTKVSKKASWETEEIVEGIFSSFILDFFCFNYTKNTKLKLKNICFFPKIEYSFKIFFSQKQFNQFNNCANSQTLKFRGQNFLWDGLGHG